MAVPGALALIVVETTDVTFAIDSIPAVLAIMTGTFVVYTATALALPDMRALYFRDDRRGQRAGWTLEPAGAAD